MKLRRLLAVAIATAAIFAVPPAASANAGVGARCVIGFVCVQGVFQPLVVLVPEGELRHFPGGLKMTRITNFTRLGYCVIGDPSFGLPSGNSVTRTQTINVVAPAGPGTVCPA